MENSMFGRKPSRARAHLALLGVSSMVLASPPAVSQEAGDAQDLAKQLANPIASLISVPLQFNSDFGINPANDGERYTLNIQPVVPLSLNEDWNVISRTILPIVYQSQVSAPGEDEFGLGDTVQSIFLSPKVPGENGIIWRAGPVLLLPSATDRFLGGNKWGVGPTAVVLKQAGHTTFGALANHIWSVAGDDSTADVSQTFFQPFVSYSTPQATTFGLNAEASYNWTSDSLTLPVNFTVNQLTTIGQQPIQVGGGIRYYIDKPAGGPDWGLRLSLTFLFPAGG
jgi:hypothetical protein